MISIVAYDRNEKERDAIRSDCREQIGINTDEVMKFSQAVSAKEYRELIESEALLDMMYYEFPHGQGTEELRAFREKYRSSLLMIVADTTVSPLEYLQPGISPDSLLLRPWKAEELCAANHEFMRLYFDRLRKKEAADSFMIDTREEKIFVQYSQIYYFEARDKKLFARTLKEEYPFYDTIDALESRLPENFQRCHRSYILNRDKIAKITLSENLIELQNKITVPVSRSYKPDFRKDR
jgi:DNA-binding LytR/AlgR family response regulator